MARLVPFDPDKPPPVRYGFDRRRLVGHFGGDQHIKELCATFGVTMPCFDRSRVRINVPTLAIMLELAERMHRPLDLYQFVIQER